MARSMTGYGIGSAAANGLSVTAELRSVNNRFLDLSFKLPRNLFRYEKEIRKILQCKTHRGRISIFISEEWEENFGPDIRYDRGKALKYARTLKELHKETGLAGDLALEHLLSVDSFFTVEESDEYKENLWTLTRQAVEDALEEMLTVSTHEGDNLVQDLTERIESVRNNLEIISDQSIEQPKIHREKLLIRLGELYADPRLDPGRLETEIAIMADRLDISEEITRLQSHLELFISTLNRSEPIGKTLGFVLQEMGREVNTIASKSWDVEIGQAAIRMKETLEQIREQVQNLE